MNEEAAKLFVAVDPNIGKLADEQEKIVNEVNEYVERRLFYRRACVCVLLFFW